MEKEVHIEKPGSVAPGQGLLWVSSSADGVTFLGQAEASLDTAFPLSRSGWLSLPGRTCVVSSDAQTVWERGHVWSGLDAFHHALLACVEAGA